MGKIPKKTLEDLEYYEVLRNVQILLLLLLENRLVYHYSLKQLLKNF